ncbi:MAG: hypothetical protein UV60_C0002G0068 [Parcubacteria group bacterium GW2011_GWA2_43_11]|nr:MAG: hypothetical protein UU89_C0003G0007 [Parcubacteria group bacterium GW2011_GWC2_42_11]KKS86263.1 MAG: hypothetical protein UV60_C0002G0068 [Parcubacteria group bacterium GW2011_GWA2_43_11]
MEKYIFKSTGQYLGFVRNDYVFSRDNLYLGWVEGDIVWDIGGNFRGKLIQLADYWYILRNPFTINPIPKIPKPIPPSSPLPKPPVNIPAISLPIGFQDGF